MRLFKSVSKKGKSKSSKSLPTPRTKGGSGGHCSTKKLSEKNADSAQKKPAPRPSETHFHSRKPPITWIGKFKRAIENQNPTPVLLALRKEAGSDRLRRFPKYHYPRIEAIFDELADANGFRRFGMRYARRPVVKVPPRKKKNRK